MKNFLTSNLFRFLIMAALQEVGEWDFQTEDGYIYAQSLDSNSPNLLIYAVARKLTRKEQRREETVMVSASLKAVTKLESRTKELADDFVPCLGFGIAKYSFDDLEIAVFPTESWQNAYPGGTLSKTSGGYYYNYEKAVNSLPNSTIVRKLWKSL